MAADYAGAVAAIKGKFTDEWTGTSADNVGFPNEKPPTQMDGDGKAAPWVMFEIVHGPVTVQGVGTPGSNTVVYDGLIKAHVFVEKGGGDDEARALAGQACTIFRNQKFYDDVTPGCYVRSGYDMNAQPRIENGEADDENGNWFSVTGTIPFEYWGRE